jgi:Zn-finger nucleic acid-binding protein
VVGVRRARRSFEADHPVLESRPLGRPRCRVCRASLPTGADRCDDGHRQQIGCPSCRKPMALQWVEPIAVDVCRPCRTVWLDEGELGSLAAIPAPTELLPRPALELSAAPQIAVERDSVSVARDVLDTVTDLVDLLDLPDFPDS